MDLIRGYNEEECGWCEGEGVDGVRVRGVDSVGMSGVDGVGVSGVDGVRVRVWMV